MIEPNGVLDPAAADDRRPLRPRGSNQIGLRQFNERVVLHALRLHGALPKAELARLTHLTPQTVQLIVGRLEADGLLRREAPLRGRVGQPSVPMALDPDGAYSIGLKVGRRSLDLLLMDFTAGIRERRTLSYEFPRPAEVLAHVAEGVAAFRKTLGRAQSRLQGLGIAAPLSLGGWQELLGLEPGEAVRWHDIDLAASIGELDPVRDLPVLFAKDTSAACVAELVAGRGRSVPSFLYVFVDTFIGGGLVLDSQLQTGRHGNAGAIGSYPVADPRRPGATGQLLGVASLLNLERLYRDARLDLGALVDDRALTEPWRECTEAWLAEACLAIAQMLNGSACLLDVETVIVDGSFGRGLLQRLMADLESALDRCNWEGVNRPTLLAGSIGSDARALGGALLPLHANFSPDRKVFLKEGA